MDTSCSQEHGNTKHTSLECGCPTESAPCKEHSKKSNRGEKTDRRLSLRHVDWRVPTLMLAALLLGIALAVGHHLFYRFWDGRALSSTFQQQWVIRGGSAFAFAANVALALACSVAYVQAMWRNIIHEPVSVVKVDSMFNVLSNILEFVDLRLWLGKPMLAILALVPWLMPLVAIVAPGTITAQVSQYQTTQMLPVAKFNYSSLDWLYELRVVGLKDASATFEAHHEYVIAQPSTNVLQVTSAVAYGGSRLLLTPPSTNSSYSLDFYGPMLSCSEANITTYSAIRSEMQRLEVWYLGWVPSHGPIRGAVAGSLHVNASHVFNATKPYYGPNSPTMDAISNGSARIYIAASTLSYVHTEYTVTECLLYNASYSVDFNFTEGTQAINVRRLQVLNQSPGRYTKAPEYSPAYLGLLAAFGGIVVGNVPQEVISQFPPIFNTHVKNTLTSGDPVAISRALEGLFINITLGAFTQPGLLSKQSETPKVPVHIYHNKLQYLYSPIDLLLTYGLAILAAVSCVCLGAASLKSTGLAFSNNFSTVLRATRDRSLEGIVKDDQSSGADSLPEYTAKAILEYSVPGKDGPGGFRVRQR